MRYLDTSVLVAALTNEPDTRRVQQWLGAHRPESLAISDWIGTELSSALSIKLRSGHIGPAHRAAALAMFARLCDDSFTILPVVRTHFRTAARFADQFGLGVRAGDALHLAICAERGAELCTLDRRIAAAGPVLGVQTEMI
jgi:uncharacterized protein